MAAEPACKQRNRRSMQLAAEGAGSRDADLLRELHEHGTPSFIAIDVHDYHTEVAFYRQVFGWDPVEVDGYHYAGYMDPASNRPIAGIGDEVESLAPGESPHWSVFWQSDDVDASVEKVSALGGAVLAEAADHGLGRVARVADPSGARFWLFRPTG